MSSKLALELLIGDDELRAIGHVAAQWAYLENQLEGVLRILMAQPAVQALGIKQSQAFQRRIENLRKAAKVALATHPQELTELLAIATDASSLRGFRDDIIHGEWKLHRNRTTGELTTGVRVLSQSNAAKVREFAFSAEKAEDIAAKISVTNLRLVIWTMRNTETRK